MNTYLSDATAFFRHISHSVKEDATDHEIVLLTMELALGLERVLKGVLYDINPLFILLEPDFKNAAKVQYQTKIVHGMEESGELTKTPNSDVITYRNSLLRSQHFSEVVSQNKALLFYLSEARDIIAHHKLGLLDLARLRLVLFRDYFPLLGKIADEQKISKQRVFDGQDFRLSELAARHQTDVKARLSILFEMHDKKWQMLKGNTGYKEDKDSVTKETLLKDGMIPCPCPACRNTAIIYTKPVMQYNAYEQREVQTGQVIRRLKCFYCKLNLNAYEEIDHLQLYAHLKSSSSLAEDVEKNENA